MVHYYLRTSCTHIPFTIYQSQKFLLLCELHRSTELSRLAKLLTLLLSPIISSHLKCVTKCPHLALIESPHSLPLLQRTTTNLILQQHALHSPPHLQGTRVQEKCCSLPSQASLATSNRQLPLLTLKMSPEFRETPFSTATCVGQE